MSPGVTLSDMKLPARISDRPPPTGLSLHLNEAVKFFHQVSSMTGDAKRFFDLIPRCLVTPLREKSALVQLWYWQSPPPCNS